MDGESLIDGRRYAWPKALSWVRTRPIRRGLARLRLVLVTGLRAREPTTVALAVTAALSIYFLIFPGVDPAVSNLFHRVDGGFVLSDQPQLKALRESSALVMAGFLIAAVAQIVRCSLKRRELAFSCARRGWFLLTGLAVGPGLVVNAVLKNQWGRPRPVQVEGFGGEAPYVPVWQVTDWCDRNCSFVSGEASSAAWMVAALVLVPERWRRIAAGPIVVYAVALSLNRVAFGGHFLSDVLLSWTITAVVMAALHRLMVTSPGAARRARRVRTESVATA